MIIFEKSWAKVNRGYDKIEGGNLFNDFEFFLGFEDSFFVAKDNENLYKAIKNKKIILVSCTLLFILTCLCY